MSGAWSTRHHTENRTSSKPEVPTYHEAGRLSRTRQDEQHMPISDQEAERLAQKIVSVAADYMDQKARMKFGEEGRVDDNAPPTLEPHDIANKVMKEAARKMMHDSAIHNDGQVFPGSDAAKAQAAFAERDDPSAPMFKVAEKVREKMEYAELRQFQPHQFQGINPAGKHTGAATPDVLPRE